MRAEDLGDPPKPSHISKIVLSTVKIGPALETRTHGPRVPKVACLAIRQVAIVTR